MFDKVRRGYNSIAYYDDNGMFWTSPHGQTCRSWKSGKHVEAIVAQSVNTRGFPPELKQYLTRSWKNEARMCRMGSMPNTVEHPRFYMKW